MTHARFAAVTTLLLAATTVNAQTLVVTYPSHIGNSPELNKLRGSPFVSGPTLIHRPATPKDSQPSAAAATADTSLQAVPGALLSVTPGANFDGMTIRMA